MKYKYYVEVYMLSSDSSDLEFWCKENLSDRYNLEMYVSYMTVIYTSSKENIIKLKLAYPDCEVFIENDIYNK